MSDELGGGGGYEAGSVYIGIEADTSPLDNLPEQIAAKISGIGAISVPFDHEPLRAGNAHIESKFTHVIDVNRRLAQHAIKPLYDGSAIEELSSDLRSLQAQIDSVQTRINLEATLNADAVRSQLDAIAAQPRVIRYVAEIEGPNPQSVYGKAPAQQAKQSVEGLGDAIAPELKKAFKDASKEFNKGNIFGGIASFVTAPLRAVGSLATQAIGGAVFGAGQQLTSGFAKGLSTSLSGKLAGSVGSPELLGEKSGDLIANFTGIARKNIVNKAKAANVAIDKAIEEGTVGFGNFSIPLDALGINKADLRTFKEEFTTAVRTSVEEYLDEFEKIFPEAQRQAESAAQRNKVRRRRQAVDKVAPQQIIDENQETIQNLTRQRSRGNTLLVNKSVEAEAIRDEVRVNRREAAQILKQIIRAETNGEIREQLIRLAAEDIPARFQGQINKLQRAYGETLEKINQKNAEIVREDNEAALLGIKPNPETKSQKLDDIQRLRAQAEKQQQDIRLQESIVQQEVEQYLSAATGETDFAPILANLKNQAIEQVKSLGEPLLQIEKEKAEIEQALRSVNTEISRLSDSSFAASSPEGKRLVLQKRLGKQQTSLTSVKGEISDTQSVNEVLLNQDSFSARDADLFRRNVLKISELEKKQQRIQRQITKTRTDLDATPGQGSQAVRSVFKEIFSELGFKGKEPEVIVDTVAATRKNAEAYYSPAANAVIIRAELNDAIEKGGLTNKEKRILREEIIHSVQFAGGSADALRNVAEAKLSGEQLQSVVKASTPTAKEVRGLAPELQVYQSSGKGQNVTVELEAKVLADRLAAREKQQATIQRITQELNTKAGFSGTALDSAYSKYLSQFTAEVRAIRQIEGIDPSEPINRYIDIVSGLSDSTKQYLDQLARLNLGQVDAAEAIQIEAAFDKQVEDISNIYQAKEALAQEIKELTQRKSESLVFPGRAEAELVPAQRIERQTVGGAISAVTSGVVIPTAQRAGDAVVAVGKAGYRAAEALEALVLDLIPAGRSLKATTKFAAKNIALPTGAAIAASQIPAIGGLEQVAVSAAGDLVHQLVGLTRSGILSQVQGIVSAAIPSFIPGSQNIVSIVSERIAALATGALDATGTATAEGLATVLSGSAVLNVLKKGVNTGIAQASRALPAAGQAILDTPQAQAISNAQIPFELPTRDRVLEIAEDLGVAARAAEDKTIQFAENALKGLRLLTTKLPEGRELIDLGLEELQTIKSRLAARFDEVSQAEREGRPVLAGRDVVRGDIKRVQQVIDAKSQPIAGTGRGISIQDNKTSKESVPLIRVSNDQYKNDLKKTIQAESKQIEKLRSQLIENLRQGSVADALQIAQQLKVNSQSALGKLESFKSSPTFDLEPAILKSVNGYITRFKDLIAQAENATAKISNDEDFGSLLSINTQQIAENFVGLINNLFEVEGKNLEDALKKAAVSPRAKDLYVNTAGFAASQVGAQMGPVPQLAGDLGGALVARQAINIGEQAIAARAELLEEELYQSANAIKKLKLVVQRTAEKLQSVELQKILGSNLSEDVTGFSIGNIAAALGQGAIPGVGAVAAMATVPKLSELRQYINERIAASQGDGEEDLGILKSISGDPLYSDKDIEVLKRLSAELAEIERLTKQIETGQERIRKIEADTTNLEQRNRRNLRFDTVGQDRNQRAAAKEVENIKAQNKAEADAEKARRDRLTRSDISTVLSDIAPRPGTDRLAQVKAEADAEKTVLSDRLEAIKRLGEEERRVEATRNQERQSTLSDRLTQIKAEKSSIQESVTPQRNDSIVAAAQDRQRQEAEAQRLKDIRALPKEASPQQNIQFISRQPETTSALTSRLEQISQQAKGTEKLIRLERELSQQRSITQGTNDPLFDRLSSIKAEAELSAKANQDNITQRLTAAKQESIIAANAQNQTIQFENDRRSLAQKTLEQKRALSKQAFEQEREQFAIIDKLERAKVEGDRENIGNRLEAIRNSQQPRSQSLILPSDRQAPDRGIRPERAADRLAAIKAEAEAQQESLTSRLESINAQRAAERNATNDRIAEIKAEAEAQKKLQQDQLIQSLEQQKVFGTRERLAASQQPRPKEDLSQYLTRVPGTSGGGNGPRVPGPPVLFIPEIQPRITAFDAAKRAASGLLGIVDKIPAPIKNIFFLLSGGFAGFQAFQILTSQANESYQAIKQLESARVVVNFATGNTNALVTAEKQANLLGTKLTESREAIKSLAIQTKNTPLEQKIVPIFEGASTAAAALQLNPEQQSRLFLAFNQIAGKGTVQSEELRQQLGELGVSFQLAARAAGLTTTEFNKQLSQGAILSQDFLPKFANQLKLELGGAAISAGDSLQGLENKVGNAAQRLQEGLGQRSIPLVSTGLKSFAGILDFAANNVQTLTNLINIALIGALIKGGQAFKTFAFEQQTFTTKDALGNVTSASQSSRAGRFARGTRDFVSGGGIQRALQSELAQDLKGIATQTIAISAGIGAFQTIAEGFSGGERYQEFNKVLETTEKRIKAIESAERDRLNLAGKKEGRTFEQVRNDLAQTGAGAIGDLLSLDFKGFNKKVARNFQQLTGGDPTTALSEGPFASQEQADNRRILNNASDLLESKKFQEET